MSGILPASAWVTEMSNSKMQELPWSVSSRERRRKPEPSICPSHVPGVLQNVHGTGAGHCQFAAEQLTQAAQETGGDREWRVGTEKKGRGTLL